MINNGFYAKSETFGGNGRRTPTRQNLPNMLQKSTNSLYRKFRRFQRTTPTLFHPPKLLRRLCF